MQFQKGIEMFNIYCDNAAQKHLTKSARKVIQTYLMNCHKWGNPSAIHSQGKSANREIESSRDTIANCINADRRGIFFTSGSTEAINWIMQTTRRNIICSKIEHKALYNNAFETDTDKCVYTVPVDKEGLIDLNKLNDLCNDRTLLVIGYVNNEIGTIQDIEAITKICHANNTLVFVDATQAIGNVPIDVQALDIDFMCGSFHKLGGLAGSGFLYCKNPNMLNPLMNGGSQEGHYRAGTENLLGIMVGAKVLEEACWFVLDEKTKEIERKRDIIINRLVNEIPACQLNGSRTHRVCNNINVSFMGIEGQTLVLWLNSYGIYCSTGSACNSKNIEPSYVLKGIGLSDDEARGAIRLTIDNDLTETDIDNLITTIKTVVNKLRKF